MTGTAAARRGRVIRVASENCMVAMLFVCLFVWFGSIGSRSDVWIDDD